MIPPGILLIAFCFGTLGILWMGLSFIRVFSKDKVTRELGYDGAIKAWVMGFIGWFIVALCGPIFVF